MKRPVCYGSFVVYIYLTAVLAVSARSHHIDNVSWWSYRRFQPKQTIRREQRSEKFVNIYWSRFIFSYS